MKFFTGFGIEVKLFISQNPDLTHKTFSIKKMYIMKSNDNSSSNIHEFSYFKAYIRLCIEILQTLHTLTFVSLLVNGVVLVLIRKTISTFNILLPLKVYYKK